MSDEEQVRAASDAFYRALHGVCRRDASLMSEAWHHTAQVSTAHPMGDWVYGWEQVWATWQELAHVLSEGAIEVLGLRIQVLGDVAVATCIEDVSLTIGERAVRWRSNVTNVFTREGGQWKMLHHHADKAPSAEQAIDEMTG
jgi:ketosteroid isomerase-like protein